MMTPREQKRAISKILVNQRRHEPPCCHRLARHLAFTKCGQEPGLLCKVSAAVYTCHLDFTGTPHSAEGLSMASSLQITGTPAEIYEQHMVPAIFVRWAPDLVEAAGVRPGDRALDVACGTGVVTRLLAERVGPTGTVVGLDIN